MNISDKGLALIKESEGLRLDAYQDSVGIWTVGYGHIKGVTEGMTITEEVAAAFLLSDLETVEKCINNCIDGITRNQFDALCSFVFNLGCMSLRNSTLLRKLKDGDDAGAAEEFIRWNHAGGRVIAGLEVRREKEKELFLA